MNTFEIDLLTLADMTPPFPPRRRFWDFFPIRIKLALFTRFGWPGMSPRDKWVTRSRLLRAYYKAYQAQLYLLRAIHEQPKPYILTQEGPTSPLEIN